MDFEYTGYIHISEADLRKMYRAVKKGVPFRDIFYQIMAGYDDEDYYACESIYNAVEVEINRRLTKNFQKTS